MPPETSTPSNLQINLLGTFRVSVDGRERSQWSRQKPKYLVKLLALQPHHQLHREQAIEILWPDSDPEAAINNLHKAIHLARHALEPELESASASHFILTEGQQIILAAPGELSIDVERFEQKATQAITKDEVNDYEQALGLYRGELLSEDPYEDWITRRREQLRDTKQELLMRLARLHESRGEHREGIKRFKELVGSDPANEEAHRHLMRLYAANGQRQQALRQYKECCNALSKELDATPERSTVELFERIVAGGVQSEALAEKREPVAGNIIGSLAILPLVNVGANPDVEYFSDGITENLINNLSQLPGLRVMAWGTVVQYKGKEIIPTEIGKRLQVQAILIGKVLQIADHLVIRVELIEALDGSQLWGQQYDRKPADVFLVQEEISREIFENLRLKLTGGEQELFRKRQTKSIAAYHCYLKGRYFWYKRTEEALKRGIEFFIQAIDEDPSYAAAYDGLSDSYALLALRGVIPHQKAFKRAKAAAKKALEIDGSLGEAHASLAHIRLHDWDWADLENEFKRALQLSPAHTIAYHWYAEYLMAMGRADEAITLVRKAQEIDPLSLIVGFTLGFAYFQARKYDQAVQQFKAALELDANHFLPHHRLGSIYSLQGLHTEAITEANRAVVLSGRSTETLAGLAQAYAAAGMIEEMRALLDDLVLHSDERYVSPYNVAKVYATGGDKENALIWLEQAYDIRHPDFIELGVEPSLDCLRGDARFIALLHRVGFK